MSATRVSLKRLRSAALPGHWRTLRLQAIIWLVAPLSVVLAGLIVVGLFVFQRSLVSLLIERHRQLASVSAVSVAEVAGGYGRVLEALGSNDTIRIGPPEARLAALHNASEALQVFDAGVMVLNQDGVLLTAMPADSLITTLGHPGQAVVQSAQEQMRPVYSGVLEVNDAQVLLVASPLHGEGGEFGGILAGATRLHTSGLSEPIRMLTVGNDGFAYLVDASGRVIFHPDPGQIGLDYSHLPFVRTVIGGQGEGILWTSPSGERLIEASAPVPAAGWGLIVQESWASAVAPARQYAMAAGVVGLLLIVATVVLSWLGVSRIVTPIQRLAGQTSRLAQGESLEPHPETGILELDGLDKAFTEMASQIAAYRAGLRRYVGAITQSQEDERRRIARELHDETIQNLLAMGRRLELYQASEDDPQRRERLAELHTLVSGTLEGVRQISRDLRPLILEDLGLIPALKTLVRMAHEGEGALPHARLEVSGEPVHLTPGQELALYRITQEALTNVRKHANATGVQVNLTFEPARVTLVIYDDGGGFEPPPSLADLTQLGSFGLMGIQERVWALEGTLEVDSEQGRGTRLRITLPRTSI